MVSRSFVRVEDRRQKEAPESGLAYSKEVTMSFEFPGAKGCVNISRVPLIPNSPKKESILPLAMLAQPDSVISTCFVGRSRDGKKPPSKGTNP